MTNNNNNQETLNAVLRNDLSYFIQKSFYTTTGNEAYHYNWHIDVIGEALQKCIDGGIKRLIINVPPRYLKSVCASVAFPAWILGKKPNSKIICVSYSQDLSDKLGFDTLNLMQSEWYKDIFPTRIHSQMHSKNDFYTTNQGFRLATSIGGTLTGRGGNFIIVDDPIKPGDTFSESQINKVNEWYSHTLLSRLDNKHEGVIIIVMQRVHENDLTGFLLETDINKEWVRINIPAIAEKDEEWQLKNGLYIRKAGEALHPERESIDHLNGLKIKLGNYVFAGQYQQNPLPMEGNAIQKNWIQCYDVLPKDPEYIIQGWDTAMKTGDANDYSACATCFVKDGKIYLAHVFRDKLLYPDLKRKVIELYNYSRTHYPQCATVLAIENRSSGTPLIDELKASGIKVESIDLQGSKESKVYTESVKFENGTFILPKQGTVSWLGDYEDELFRFPQGQHDDQVDATIIALSCFNMDLTISPPVKPLIRTIYTGKYPSSNQGMDERRGNCDSTGRALYLGSREKRRR